MTDALNPQFVLKNKYSQPMSTHMGHQIHEYLHPEKGKLSEPVDVYHIKFGDSESIEVLATLDQDQVLRKNKLSKLSKALSYLSPKLRELVGNIVISPQSAQSVWENSGTVTYLITKEVGYLADAYLGKSLKTGEYFSKDAEWLSATGKDSTQAYRYVSSLPREDFSQAFAIWFGLRSNNIANKAKSTYETAFKNRFEVLDKYFANLL